MKQHIFTFFFICIICTATAQIPQRATNLQSPNISTLGLFGDIPVSLFTGTPSIEIPLYKIQDMDIEIPLSMAYHSAGIRPDQHPGWTGLGWGLQVGGAIYRTVNDMADDYNNSKYYYGKNSGYYFNHNILNTTRWNERAYLREVAQDDKMLMDTEPDEFCFSFLGYNGKFYLDHLGKWQVQCDKPLKVEFNGTFLDIPFDKSDTQAVTYGYSPCFSGFTIYGEDGMVYVFGGKTDAIDYSLDFFDQYNSEWIAGAWYLTKIVSPKGNEAVFKYERGDFTNQMYMSIYDNFGSYTEASGGIFNPQPECSTSGSGSITARCSGKLLAPVYLASIDTPNTKASFTRSLSQELRYSTDAYAWDYANWLRYPSKIAFLPVLKSHKDGFPECLEKLKWYKLDYIKISLKPFGQLAGYRFKYGNTSNERLLLSSIEDEIMETSQKKYSFGYNQANLLPKYLSNRTDHWGFYNNVNAGINASNYYSQREPNSSVLVYGVLNKITYPTGGYTQFIFEPHLYRQQLSMNRWERCELLSANKVAGGLRIWRIINNSTGNKQDDIVEKEYFYVTDYLTDKANPNRSSGILGGRIQYQFSDYVVYAFNDKKVRRKMNLFSSQSVLPACLNSQGSHIGYSEVIEKRADGSFTRFQFTNFDNGHMDDPADAIIQESHTPYEPYASRGSERGKTMAVEEYSSGGEKKRVKKFQYERSSENFVRSMKASYQNVCPGTSVSYDEGTSFKTFTYVYRLKQEKDIVYDVQSSPVFVTKSYSYNRNGFIKEIAQTTNNGIRKVTYKRPDEYSDEVYASMVTRNILSPVVEEAESLLTPSGNLRPIRKKRSNYLLFQIGSKNCFAISSIEDSISSSLWRKSYECFSFDEKGNPVSFNINEKPFVYKWGYNGLYPIAVFEGTCDSSDLYYNDSAIIGPFTVSLPTKPNKHYTISYKVFSINGNDLGYKWANFENGTHTINEGRCQITNIRVHPNDVSVTTFRHAPMVGLLSQTNERGITESYEYETYGRLKIIRDNNKKVIKSFDYKYSNKSIDDEPENDNYCNVTFDASALGGDGTIKTVKMKFGEQLPIPTPVRGYVFDGWYDGDVKITTVPDSSSRTLNAKFKERVLPLMKITIGDSSGKLSARGLGSNSGAEIEISYVGNTISLSKHKGEVIFGPITLSGNNVEGSWKFLSNIDTQNYRITNSFTSISNDFIEGNPNSERLPISFYLNLSSQAKTFTLRACYVNDDYIYDEITVLISRE